MARKRIIAGNWKMNKTPSEAVALVNELKDLVKNDAVDVVYCVPAVDIVPVVDAVKGTVQKDDQEIFLSALEYRLLLYFLNNQGIILSRSKLLEALWDIAGEFVNDNTLTVYIKRLREKIEENPQTPLLIKTVRGLGYKMGD